MRDKEGVGEVSPKKSSMICTVSEAASPRYGYNLQVCQYG